MEAEEDGIEIFSCNETAELFGGGYATINMSNAKNNIRTKADHRRIDTKMTQGKTNITWLFFKPTTPHTKWVQPKSYNWDEGKVKKAQMVNSYIIRIDDNPAFDFVNCNKTSVLWDPHWSCCRKRFDAPGCTLRKHIGPPVDEFQGEVVPKQMWKAGLKKNRREDSQV